MSAPLDWEKLPPNVPCNCTSFEITLFKQEAISLGNMSQQCIDLLPSCNYNLGSKVLLGFILSIIACGTFFGNVLVVMAVALVKKLQNPSNLLIVSLACSDLLVGLLVLPFAIIYQLMNYFPFPEEICNFWTSCDVLLCTSSILNLCAISIDRYLVITKPFEYAVKRTPVRMGLMIAAVWLLSACISIPPLFSSWKNKFSEGHCGYPTNTEYQVYAVFVAFYLPLIIMLVLYGNIFKLARKMAKADEKQKVVHLRQEDKNLIDEQLAPNNNGGAGGARPSVQSGGTSRSGGANSAVAAKKKSSSDTKAIKTLGVIMGCFTLCWLPFFIMQLVGALYKPIHAAVNKLDVPEPMYINEHMFAIFLWLGYVNSFLNPIIYAKFNRDFRMPFKHILLCHCRSINNRLRAEQYAEQYGLTGNSRKASSAATSAGRLQRRRSSDANARRARHNLDNGAEHAM
ncbi:hypothetical protein BOX15_Mlig006460g1 [Macrostomum lignano]|uniref:G-protein coupled receptors family 1 profile domain-containing protein n=1 Tax=Macrostomum lignano TaxID=282301 RepID=A0A267DL39_9PLAT|nr:hypothetical protein BOX15_Mlig006460g1 [Macrostomum lignano]